MDNNVELREQFKKYAKEHYNDGGWDVIVECWDNEQIDQFLAGTDVDTRFSPVVPCTTLAEAIERIAPVIDVWADRQADARHYKGE